MENPQSKNLVGPVGPYRIERLLGRGGMGEVYAGYDERLDRPVALKRVWRDKREETHRKRFQREARAVARLHHPAIVQVFDWVESEEGDWIVMEYVRGRSLRDLMNEGPLEPDRALRILQDVLEGLAVAHASSIVHRDLKAENVMIAPGSAPGKSEQAKILDFGLAKRFDLEDPETQLSVEGGLIGTLTAMSPEQVHGRDIGPRSDLFSLGSLLYEMLTGVSPFRGATAGETLQKICTWNPPTVSNIESSIPGSLSAFVERLLGKDLRRRPQDAGQALVELRTIDDGGSPLPGTEHSDRFPQSTLGDGTRMPSSGQDRPDLEDASSLGGRISWLGKTLFFLLLTLLAIAGFWLSLPEKPTLHVVVPQTVMESGDADFDPSLATRAIKTGLLRGLLAFERVVALEPQQEEAALSDTTALVRAMAGDEALTSSLKCIDRFNCQLVLRRVEGKEGKLLWTQVIVVEPTDLLGTSLAVIEHLRNAYPEARLRKGVPDLQVSVEDYERYLDLRDQFQQRPAGFSSAQAVEELEVLQRTSPRYLALPLFEARIRTILFQENRDGTHLEKAKAALERARRMSPTHPQVLIAQVDLARIAGDYETASESLEVFKRLHPGNIHRFYLEARLLEHEGRFEAALDVMREGIDQRPSVFYQLDYSGMLSRQGRLEEARQVLEAALVRVPEFYSGLSRLAQLELLNGSPERAVEYYERLVARSPEATELTNLGTAYLLTEQYDEAAARFRQALALSPSSIPTLLNLADAESLSGNETSATELYRQVLERLDADPNPSALLTVRAQALAHLGRVSEAVSAVQESLRQNPENPMTAYEASLVFALVGDRASAQWNAGRALAHGVDPRWFDFPWFDLLRSEIDDLVTSVQDAAS